MSKPPALEDRSRKRATNEEIAERKETIARILRMYPDYPRSKLAETYEVDISTIYHYIAEIEEDAWDWANRQANTGLVYQCKVAAERCDQFITKIQQNMDRADVSPTSEAYLMKISMELTMIGIQLRGKGTYQQLAEAKRKYLALKSSAEKVIDK